MREPRAACHACMHACMPRTFNYALPRTRPGFAAHRRRTRAGLVLGAPARPHVTGARARCTPACVRACAMPRCSLSCVHGHAWTHATCLRVGAHAHARAPHAYECMRAHAHAVRHAGGAPCEDPPPPNLRPPCYSHFAFFPSTRLLFGALSYMRVRM